MASALFGSDLDAAEAGANVLSITGQLMMFFGPIMGGAVLGSIASIIAIGAVNYSNNLRQQILLERYLAGTTTPGPTIPTTADPSKIRCNFAYIHNDHFLF